MGVDQSKHQLIEAFYHRLVESYGYLPDQLDFNVEISASSVADIAIWRSADEKKLGLTPNIYVLVVCKAEHIKIKAEDYSEQLLIILKKRKFFILIKMLGHSELNESVIFLLQPI